MKNGGLILGINLLVLLVYSLVIHFTAHGEQKSLWIMIVLAGVISLHVISCAVISSVYYGMNKREVGKTWLLASGVVLLVGFSTCLGNAHL